MESLQQRVLLLLHSSFLQIHLYVSGTFSVLSRLNGCINAGVQKAIQFAFCNITAVQSKCLVNTEKSNKAKMTRESEFTVHGNPSNLNAHHILNIMFCNDCLILQNKVVACLMEYNQYTKCNRTELAQTVTLVLTRERAASSRIHNTPSHSTANERVRCSALSS